jgi:UPF0755 protein
MKSLALLRLKPLIIIYSILLALIILLNYFVYAVYYKRYYRQQDETKRIEIKKGESLDEIITRLKKEDIISNEFLTKAAFKLSGKEQEITAQSFIIKNGINNIELMDLLTSPEKTTFVKVTIIEGISIRSIGRSLEKQLHLSKDKFIAEAQNVSLIKDLNLKDSVKNLEGFLFPDTYFVDPGIDEKGMVQLMVSEFKKRVLGDSLIKSAMSQKGDSLLQILTMASIIDGETRKDSEKPVIAGVYYNRLRKNIKLEADPTIQYSLPDGPKSRLMYSDLNIESPYNTYKYKGLPPGPINNPGITSIKAALFPDTNNYLFFVADGTGGHKFAETYSEHQQNVAAYRKMLQELKELKELEIMRKNDSIKAYFPPIKGGELQFE